MLAPITETSCEIDDFCKTLFLNDSQQVLPDPNRKRNRACRMAASAEPVNESETQRPFN